MNTKHTPGPWESIGQIIVGGHPLEHICRWSGRSANSKLIAAAPDLLEACQKVKNLANRLLDYGEIDQEIAGELLLIVNPIIKKAGAE